MRRIAPLALALLLPVAASAEETKEIGHMDTAWTNLGLTRSHQIVIERFDDPKIEGVSCYIAQARTGGVKGMVGLAEDPARFAISCTATGPVKVSEAARRSERIGGRSSSYSWTGPKVRSSQSTGGGARFRRGAHRAAVPGGAPRVAVEAKGLAGAGAPARRDM